jgi:hypothetical protein
VVNSVASDEAPGIRCELRLYKRQKRLDIQFEMRKGFVAEPESIYISFPFALQDGRFVYEAQGGLVTPGENQLPGSSADWHTMQNFVSLRDDDGQIIFGSDQIPLVQFGDINMGKWQYIAKVEKPDVFFWVINNYWTYNLRGSKESEFTWSYYLTSTKDTSNTAATRFGWASRTPLAARLFAGSKQTDGVPSFSTLNLDAPNVLVVNAVPGSDGDGITLHLREVEGRETEVRLHCPTRGKQRIDILDVLGQVLEGDVSSVALEPFEVKFVKLTF